MIQTSHATDLGGSKVRNTFAALLFELYKFIYLFIYLFIITRATHAIRKCGFLLSKDGWMDGTWLDVTRRYCVKTAKPTLKPFRPSGSPIILVSSTRCADTKFQGKPLKWQR